MGCCASTPEEGKKGISPTAPVQYKTSGAPTPQGSGGSPNAIHPLPGSTGHQTTAIRPMQTAAVPASGNYGQTGTPGNTRAQNGIEDNETQQNMMSPKAAGGLGSTGVS